MIFCNCYYCVERRALSPARRYLRRRNPDAEKLCDVCGLPVYGRRIRHILCRGHKTKVAPGSKYADFSNIYSQHPEWLLNLDDFEAEQVAQVHSMARGEWRDPGSDDFFRRKWYLAHHYFEEARILVRKLKESVNPNIWDAMTALHKAESDFRLLVLAANSYDDIHGERKLVKLINTLRQKPLSEPTRLPSAELSDNLGFLRNEVRDMVSVHCDPPPKKRDLRRRNPQNNYVQQRLLDLMREEGRQARKDYKARTSPYVTRKFTQAWLAGWDEIKVIHKLEKKKRRNVRKRKRKKGRPGSRR